ncbi:MAG: hypothetical protein J6X47_00940 [Clostridia bacterium]|nr:hypothetical protein [Clostridia bacterium]
MPFILLNKNRGELSAAATVIFAGRGSSASRVLNDTRQKFAFKGGCTVKKGIHITSVTRSSAAKKRSRNTRSELVLIAKMPARSRVLPEKYFRKLLISSLKKVSDAGLDSVVIFCPSGLEASSGSFSLYKEALDVSNNLFPEMTVYFAAGGLLSGELTLNSPQGEDVDGYLAANYRPATEVRPVLGSGRDALVPDYKHDRLSAVSAKIAENRQAILSMPETDHNKRAPSRKTLHHRPGHPKRLKDFPDDTDENLYEAPDECDVESAVTVTGAKRRVRLDEEHEEEYENEPAVESRLEFTGAPLGAAAGAFSTVTSSEARAGAVNAVPFHALNAVSSIDDNLSGLEDGFATVLFKMIDARGLTDPECYRRANVDRKLFSKIRNNPDYHPRKDTVLAFCIALCLTPEESSTLLASAGYTLSNSIRRDVIVKYFLEKGVYDIIRLNEVLFEKDEQPLGSF